MNIRIDSENPVVQSQLDVLRAVAPAVLNDEIAHIAVVAFDKNGKRRSHITTSPSDHALNLPSELVPAYSQMEMGLSLINALECVLEKEKKLIPYVREDALYLRQKLLELVATIEEAATPSIKATD